MSLNTELVLWTTAISVETHPASQAQSFGHQMSSEETLRRY